MTDLLGEGLRSLTRLREEEGEAPSLASLVSSVEGEGVRGEGWKGEGGMEEEEEEDRTPLSSRSACSGSNTR